MFRPLIASIAGLMLATGAALAADREVKGTLVHVDAARHTISISEDGKQSEFNLAERGVAVFVAGKESAHELKDRSLVKGAEVTLHLAATGKTVHEIHVGHHSAGARPSDAKAGEHEPRGTAATVTRVDANRNIIVVRTAEGKSIDLHVGEDTKFIGPQGGHREKGIKDDVVAAGAKIHYVVGKNGKIEEVHLAAGREVKGTLVHVDAARHTISISEDGKQSEFNLAERGVAVFVAGKESAHELKDRSLIKGAEVTLHLAATGKTVHEIHVGHHSAGTRSSDAKAGEHEPRGTAATITRVDASKHTIVVKTAEGKSIDLHVGEDTRFIGPQGGHREKGIKDDVVAVGAKIHYVVGKTGNLEEVHLPRRHSESEDKKPVNK